MLTAILSLIDVSYADVFNNYDVSTVDDQTITGNKKNVITKNQSWINIFKKWNINFLTAKLF